MLDVEGTGVGRVAEVVIGASSAQRAPSVLGFVVAVPGRRIFVSAGRVQSLGPDGLRLASGSINLRRFVARPTETLVLHDLLDQRLPSGEVVNDVGLEPARDRAWGWDVASVDVRPADARLRLGRRRASRTLPWQAISPLLRDGRNGRGGYDHLRGLHPVEVAASVRGLPAQQRADAARSLDDEQLADVLEELPEEVQAELLDEMDLERAADVLEVMQPDDAADLLAYLEGERRGALLEAMLPAEAEPLRRLLGYAQDTAGGLMTPEPIVLVGSTTVAEALARLRDPDLPAATAAQVFVVEPPTETPTGKFLGVCSIQRLLREPPGRPVAKCLERNCDPVAPTLSEAQVARLLAAYNLLALPVCDEDSRLLGAVTVDDVLDRVLPEGWRQR